MDRVSVDVNIVRSVVCGSELGVTFLCMLWTDGVIHSCWGSCICIHQSCKEQSWQGAKYITNRHILSTLVFNGHVQKYMSYKIFTSLKDIIISYIFTNQNVSENMQWRSVVFSLVQNYILSTHNIKFNQNLFNKSSILHMHAHVHAHVRVRAHTHGKVNRYLHTVKCAWKDV